MRGFLVLCILVLVAGCGVRVQTNIVNIRDGFDLVDRSPFSVGYLLPLVSSSRPVAIPIDPVGLTPEQMRQNPLVKFQEQLRKQRERFDAWLLTQAYK